MYTIRKRRCFSTTKILILRAASLGLGIAIVQLLVGLHRILQLYQDENYNFFHIDEEKHWKWDRALHEIVISGPGETGVKNKDISSTTKPYFMSRGTILAGVFTVTQLYVCVLEVYLYALLRSATHKENVSNGRLGLYVTMLLLTYNMTQILIVACRGVFDGSSALLAAKTSVRALSIEMICLFLREIEHEENTTDAFLYVV